MASQGEYGKNMGGIYDSIFEVIEPVLCSNKFLKVGQNLGYEYQVFHWCFGKRIWHLYSTDMAERVIQAGTISLKKMAEFSMASIAGRHFGLLIDKTMQETFDLESPLTQEQIDYAAFDVRFPFAMRQAQMNIMTADQLLATAQIENDAIGTFTDMHLVGQNLDDAKWVERIKHVIERRIGELKILDEGFLPYVGNKHEQIDEAAITAAELVWRTGFEVATPREAELAAQKRLEKDKTKKAEIGLLLKAEEQKRAAAKAAARKACSALTKHRTAVNKKLEKCEGEAFINFDSQSQLLEALQKVPGMKSLQDVQDSTLLKFNDRPLIQTLRRYKKGKKDTGTYGIAWCQRWITKPLAKEGWRHPVDGRLHCQFNQLSAETGRSTSSKPNAQNLPAEKDVRSCFIVDPPDAEFPDGYSMITIDLEGAELRILAELSGAQSWLKAFALGQDLHSVCCEILYPDKWPSLALPECAYFEKGENGEPKRQKCDCPEHKKLRGETKSTNFLLVYGGGPQALADAIDSSLDRAKELMQNHEKAFPDIWNFLELLGKKGKEQKEARSLFGRRRSFADPTYESAREWVKSNEEEKLELNEALCEDNIFQFKTKNLREPNEKEKWSLTHRSPTDREIRHGMAAMLGSIERKSKNHPMQSTNADIVKRAMGCGADAEGKQYLWHTLPKFHAKLVNMVHDELCCQAPTIYAKQVAELMQDALRRAGAEVCKNVIMTSEYHIGPCWQK
jgi:DNA polymerase I-like protein with 3'-5' exonuclease and polymerase domains